MLVLVLLECALSRKYSILVIVYTWRGQNDKVGNVEVNWAKLFQAFPLTRSAPPGPGPVFMSRS